MKDGGEQHYNEFRDINPMEQVPALQIDGHTLIQSVSLFEIMTALFFTSVLILI